MATWFSHPIKWDGTKLDPNPDPENRMKVSADAGPIKITALYDGFVVYRPKSASPETGNLELVLMPDKWPDEMQKFFNPLYPQLAHSSRLTELPPGRVVYLDLPKSVIKQNLHKLILDNFMVFVGDQKKIHRTLNFIPDIGPTQLKTLKAILLEAWNSKPIEDRQKKVDAAIDNALDQILSLSVNDPLLRGLPVQGEDVLCAIGDSKSPSTVIFEIRNLYGEPLNPHFYLKSIGGTHADLTPAPPFPAEVPPPRFRTPNSPLFIRIPKTGGVEYDLAKSGEYKSPLIWKHLFDAANGSHTTSLEPRPGETVQVPVLDGDAQDRVNKIWDTDFFPINKHAEIFQVPCELILSTIFNESHHNSTLPTDLHSIHTEPIEAVAPFPQDYEDLIKRSKETGSKLTKKTIEAYFGATGGFATDSRGLAYPPREKHFDGLKLPKVKPAFPFDSTARIGTSENLKEITWAQLDEIVQLKPQLVATDDMQLPPLGRTSSGDYQYDLITRDVGSQAAQIYWATVGGVRLKDGKEDPSRASRGPLTGYPLPTTKSWPALVDPTDATKVVTWEQLLSLLDVLRKSKAKNVPEAVYTLVPLGTTSNYSYSTLFARPELMKRLPVTEDQADNIMARYFALMTQGLVFLNEVGPAKEPGVRREPKKSEPPPPETEYLTLEELKALSEIYPDRISIGVGQITFETASRFVVPWIKTHFGNAFFTDQIGAEVPPDGFKERIPWMWNNVWENEEFQIALIASYHKQNATTFWQSFKEKEASGGNTYRCGDLMTRFDFPRVGSAYNAGYARKAFQPVSQNPDSVWGLHTSGKYFVGLWSSITYAVTRFLTIPPGDPTEPRVRLRPDIETNTGMEPR
ncbi:MAG TPA: hypothetical protein VGJ37_14580 [Pyrinomonadaceae bacterium]|jgi:hypothetical protein